MTLTLPPTTPDRSFACWTGITHDVHPDDCDCYTCIPPTEAEQQALYQHLEDILCCIAGAAVAHEDGNDRKIREHHQEAMDRCWLLMTSPAIATT